MSADNRQRGDRAEIRRDRSMHEPNRSVARYIIDREESRLRFGIRLVAWKVQGSFTDVDGWVDYDEERPDAMTADASVRVASIRTGNQRRDEHLLSPDFFDADRFPVIRFVGRRATDLGGGGLRLEVDLTIRGATRRTSFEIRRVVAGRDDSGRRSLGFTATSRINRFDYGAGGRTLLDVGGIVVSRQVDAEIQIFAVRDP
jgi:polyisoprenoid-binding protein YceI